MHHHQIFVCCGCCLFYYLTYYMYYQYTCYMQLIELLIDQSFQCSKCQYMYYLL